MDAETSTITIVQNSIGQGLTSGWLVIDLRADLLTGER